MATDSEPEDEDGVVDVLGLGKEDDERDHMEDDLSGDDDDPSREDGHHESTDNTIVRFVTFVSLWNNKK